MSATEEQRRRDFDEAYPIEWHGASLSNEEWLEYGLGERHEEPEKRTPGVIG